MALEYQDHREDPQGWAAALGISREAIDVYLASDVIDLHVDTFIWQRMLGYDMRTRHGLGPLRGRFFSQVDLVRIRQAQISGAMWSITTSPWRSAKGRLRAFRQNLLRLKSILESEPADVALVRNLDEYKRARGRGLHAAFIAIQGGNAVDADLSALDALEDDVVVRVTLVHLSNSRIGDSSVPTLWGEARGLSNFGRAYVELLNQRRVLVDLSHIGKRAFGDVVAMHDRSLPLVVTHTGVDGAYRCWRNLDDDQIRYVAQFGGTVGIIFHSGYLNGRQIRRARVADVARHILHVTRVVGDDHVSIGSDFDGMIVPPGDLPSCLELPRLVQALLEGGLSAESISKILGGNFLRVLAQLRG